MPPIIARLTALPPDLPALQAAARAEGFAFLDRLATEWTSGANRFHRPGECLLAATNGPALAGIGGLNQDPYASNPVIGRLRHLYVLPEARRAGIATALVQALLARSPFQIIRLRTATPDAARLYLALGFTPVDDPQATHILTLR